MLLRIGTLTVHPGGFAERLHATPLHSPWNLGTGSPAAAFPPAGGTRHLVPAGPAPGPVLSPSPSDGFFSSALLPNMFEKLSIARAISAGTIHTLLASPWAICGSVDRYW